MKDIANRDVNEGDIVVVDGVFGIYHKKSVRIQGGKWKAANKVYLVDSPKDFELAIKETILKEIEAEEAATEFRQKATAHQIADDIGKIYILSNNTAYLYCGWGNVRRYQGNTMEVLDGHVYIPLPLRDNMPMPEFLRNAPLTWANIEAYIKKYDYADTMSVKVFKKPGKYKKVYPYPYKLATPRNIRFDKPSVNFTMLLHLPNNEQ